MTAQSAQEKERVSRRRRAANTAPVQPLFADLPTAAAMLSISESAVQKLVREGELSPPRKITSGRVGWLVREIVDFAESRPVSDLLPPPNTGGRQGDKAANDEQRGR